MNEQSGPGITVPGPSWEVRYARRLAVTDFIVISWAVIGAQITRFGFNPAPPVLIDSRRQYEFDIAMGYTGLSVLLVVAWMLALILFGTRDSRVVGAGTAEYKRIIDATLRLFGVLAILAFLLRVDIARAYVLLAFPIGTLAVLWTRWLWRQWLVAKRERGQYSARVVLLGSLESVIEVARALARTPGAGYRVVAVVTTDVVGSRHLLGTTIPLSGDLDRVSEVMLEHNADTLVVTSSNDLPPQRVRELSWSLEPGRQHLVVAPSLTDVGGPRILTRPVAGLPLMHVETPRYGGLKAFTKRAFDLTVSGILILVLSPLLAAVVMAVRLTSNGPVLYRSQRIGHGGEPFEMLKFRSMHTGADLELAKLLTEQGSAAVPLFKIKDDPRITPLGRTLRKYSLDELPQLFNVFLGSMSLVGPRPQVAAEVALYDDTAARRLLLKPGISGLWQVSGRSALGWEDAIRLDLYYVENWSLTGDIAILWRTIRTVLGPGETAH